MNSIGSHFIDLIDQLFWNVSFYLTDRPRYILFLEMIFPRDSRRLEALHYDSGFFLWLRVCCCLPHVFFLTVWISPHQKNIHRHSFLLWFSQKRNTHKKRLLSRQDRIRHPQCERSTNFFSSAFLCVYTTLHGDFFFCSSLYSCSLSMTLLGWEGWHYLRRKAFLPSLFIYNSVESFPCGWMKLEIGKRKNTRNFFFQWFLFFFRLLFLFFSGPLATDTIAQ